MPVNPERQTNFLRNPSGYLDHLGLTRLQLPDLHAIGASFAKELRGGLKEPPKLESLKMIRTLLHPIAEGGFRSHAGEEVVVLEIGGTNVSCRRYEIREDGTPHVSLDAAGKELQTGQSYSKRIFNSPTEFFSEVIPPVAPILGYRPIDKFAIVYTLPAEAVERLLGVDAISPDDLPKELHIEDIHLRPVGEQLLDYMQATKKYSLEGLRVMMVANDTPFVLLSAPGRIGGVVGTGYNFAISVNGEIYNLECGGFSGVPDHLIARLVDGETANKGFQLAEKQISGMYLGWQLDVLVRHLHKHGFMNLVKRPDSEHKVLEGEVLTHIFNNDRKKLSSLFDGDIDGSMLALRTIAERLKTRSAQIVTMKLATIVNTFPQEFSEDKVIVPIEGSVFWRMPGYKEAVEREARLFVHGNKTFYFPKIDHPAAMGAIASVLERTK